MIQGDLGILRSNFVRSLSPEDGSCEDVSFVDRGEPFITPHRGLKSDVQDVFDL